MARPKTTVLRDRQLNISLTQREFEAVRVRAERAGLRLTEFARAVLLSQQLTLAEPRAADSVGQRLIHAQLQRLGNNLNQMVRHVHATGDPMPADLEPLLRDIRAAVQQAHV